MRRRPGPIGALFWLIIALCALIALAEVYPPITAPLAVLLVVAIVWGAVNKARRNISRNNIGGKVTPRASVERVTVEHQAEDCSVCGAPVDTKATTCPFCGNAYWRGGVRRTTERLP